GAEGGRVGREWNGGGGPFLSKKEIAGSVGFRARDGRAVPGARAGGRPPAGTTVRDPRESHRSRQADGVFPNACLFFQGEDGIRDWSVTGVQTCALPISAFVKLDPRVMIKRPVMFVVEVVAALTTVIFLRDLVTGGASLGFTFQIILWLWFTVLFANFAEAVAEGRGKAQAESLKKPRTGSQAKLLAGSKKTYRLVSGTSLKIGDVVLVEAGDNIPSDGEVIEGVASVNEAAITGESAPVIRESGGDRSAVTGG